MSCPHILGRGLVWLAAILGSSVLVVLFTGRPIYDADDPAASYIANILFVDNHELSRRAATVMGAALSLSLLAMPHVPRKYRIVPMSTLAFGILYVNTWWEHKYTLEATGRPIPLGNVLMHFVAASAYIASIFLPEPKANLRTRATPSTSFEKYTWVAIWLYCGAHAILSLLFVGSGGNTELFRFPNDVAADTIVGMLFRDGHPLSQYSFVVKYACRASILPALAVAPRKYRVAPLLILAWSVIHLNTFLEHQYVVEATNLGIPLPNVIIHIAFAGVYIATIALPN